MFRSGNPVNVLMLSAPDPAGGAHDAPRADQFWGGPGHPLPEPTPSAPRSSRLQRSFFNPSRTTFWNIPAPMQWEVCQLMDRCRSSVIAPAQPVRAPSSTYSPGGRTIGLTIMNTACTKKIQLRVFSSIAKYYLNSHTLKYCIFYVFSFSWCYFTKFWFSILEYQDYTLWSAYKNDA